MLLCGATMTFAQQNEPVYTERLDSITRDGYLEWRVDYEDNGDFYFKSCYVDADGNRHIGDTVQKYNKQGKLLYSNVYINILGEKIPYSKTEKEYDSNGNCIKSCKISYNRLMGTLRNIKVQEEHVDAVTKHVIKEEKLFSPDSVLTQVREDEYDEKGVWLQYQTTVYGKSGQILSSEKNVQKYDSSGRKTGVEFYELYGSGWVLETKWKYVYNEEGKRVAWNIYSLKNNGEMELVEYEKYSDDVKEETTEDGKIQRTYYTRDSEGRVTEQIVCEVGGNGSEIKKEKAVFTDYSMYNGYPYCICETFTTNDDGNTWTSVSHYVHFPRNIINGKPDEDTHYVIHSDAYAGCYVHLEGKDYDSYDVRVYDAVPVYVGKQEYRYNDGGDILSSARYETANGTDFTLVEKNVYFYDEQTLGSKVAGVDAYYKPLYESYLDGNGKETSRTTYHYSPYSTTGISSVASSSYKAQAIYNLNGQKVSSTLSGQIYIKDGKKFIAK